jgi:hypothetical protein
MPLLTEVGLFSLWFYKDVAPTALEAGRWRLAWRSGFREKAAIGFSSPVCGALPRRRYAGKAWTAGNQTPK